MTTIARSLVSASGGWQRVHHWVALCAIALVAIAVASPPAAHAANARRQLEVQNHTSEPVRVFVAYHSITPGERWEWFNTDDTTSWLLQPGQRTLLVDRGFKINADLVRIRARAEKTGRTWNWGEVFIGSAAPGPSRVVGKTLLTVWAEDGLAQFSDRHTRRTLAVKNETKETLTICVAYHTRTAEGSWGWQNPDCQSNWTFKPGEHSNLAIDNKRISANAIKIYARSAAGDRVWVLDRDKALFVGDYEGTGGFQGTYTYTFTEANGRRFAPLVLRAVRLNPPKVAAGRSVEVIIEYTVDGFDAGTQRRIQEEQRIERDGKVLGSFQHIVHRAPGSYRSRRRINIPLLTDPGEYRIVGAVTLGRQVKGFLGVHIKPVPPATAQQVGLTGPQGALVADVVPDSPGARGGLKPGDIITRFNDRAVDTYRQLLDYTAGTASGTTVTLSIIRDGAEQGVTVTLGAPPKDFPKPRVASKSVTLTVTNP